MEARIANRVQVRPSARAIERPRLLPQLDEGLHQRSAVAAGRTESVQANDVLLQEMQHRVGNSLQIIASILALHVRQVRSEEARLHLEDAHRRILAVGAVQRFLYLSRQVEQVGLAAYLHHLCDSLSASLVGEGRAAIDLQADADTVSPTVARNIGLIVTELVINALKHGFPDDGARGLIVVTYRVEKDGWTLSVSDNGAGALQAEQGLPHTGLGMAIIAALVKQIDGCLRVADDTRGRSVTVSHGPEAGEPGRDAGPAALR